MDTTLRILFVEDNEHDRIAFKRVFKEYQLPCAITEYERAEEALERLQSDESYFDIVITDQGLPGMSGLEFCKELLARKTKLPLIILTGKGTEQIASDALKSGVYDYIIKDDYNGYLKLLPVTIAGVVNKHNEKRLRIKAEEQNKEWNNRYEAAVKASGQVLYDWDSETNEVVYGGDLEERLGYTTEEMEGGLSRWTELIHPDDRDGFKKTIEDIIATKKPARREYRVCRKDGNYIFVEDNGRFFANAKGNISQMIGFIKDITGRKQAEEKIKELNKTLEQRVIKRTVDLVRANEQLQKEITERKKIQTQLIQSEKLSAIGMLSAGVTHELNSPLDGLLTMLRIRKKKASDDPDEYKKLTIMVDAAEHMARIIKDLGLFSRETTGKFSQIDANDMIESTLSFTGFHLMAHNINITKDYAGNLLNIQGDTGQLQQVVLNIITNAHDAMLQGGELVIRTRNSEDGDKVIMEFIDTGVGIKEEILHRLFDPFFTTKERGAGIGLGLSISHGIIKNHNGEFLVESPPDGRLPYVVQGRAGKPGKGTKFTIVLPTLKTEG